MLTQRPFQGLAVETAAVCQTQLAPIKGAYLCFSQHKSSSTLSICLVISGQVLLR